MAQAVFDEHPIEQYLRDAGEPREPMPGATTEIELELDPKAFTEIDWDEDEDNEEWRPLFLIQLYELLLSFLTSLDSSSHTTQFAERFKYDVISSSLLTVSLVPAHGRTPRTLDGEFPGQLESIQTPVNFNESATSETLPQYPYLIPSLSVLISAAFLQAGYTLFTIVSFAFALYAFSNSNEPFAHDMFLTLESLHELIAASDEWESAIQEATGLVDSEEQSLTYSGPSSSSPISSLRIALHTALFTTQSQCDNVRQLLAAITTPSTLSQLSEMYAPPSPMPFGNFTKDSTPRPYSLPARKKTLSISTPTTPLSDKRATWNGTLKLSESAESPAAKAFRRHSKRRSDLAGIFDGASSPLGLRSPPATPPSKHGALSPRRLSLVNETSEDFLEEDEDNDNVIEIPRSNDGAVPFGAAALELRRNRLSAGLSSFRVVSSPSYLTSPLSTPPSLTHSPSPRTPASSSTLSSGSRLTPVHASRNPLSVGALTHALQGALGSKRYACSHLLALRFADEEDEAYWDNVRSVMALLTSTMLDTASRLEVSLREVEQQKLRDMMITPTSDAGRASGHRRRRSGRLSGDSIDGLPIESSLGRRRTSGSVSFAPLPSHLSRFGVHVDSIKSALDDARENLDQCLESLREEAANDGAPRRRRRQPSGAEEDEGEVSKAIEAYERLRKELGLALRECERGKEKLMDIIYPPEPEPEDHSEDENPGLAHDASDDSEPPPFPPDHDTSAELYHPDNQALVALSEEDHDGPSAMDDTTSHLLFTSSTHHLPPPGIEQVYEAESGTTGPFKRERSKLTREERIKLMKSRRESGGTVLGVGVGDGSSQPPEPPASMREKWGPGGEVVQELKDVIWKVGEKRRKMADAALKGAGNAFNRTDPATPLS